MRNVIFLDIDGVINDNDSEFLLENITALNKLKKEYNAQIVFISSHQSTGTENRRKKIKEKLKQYNIIIEDFIDPNFKGNMCGIKIPSRVIGIVDYLIKVNNCNYIILDDEFHNDYKLLCLNYYKTNPNKGLKLKDIPKINFKPVNLNNFKYLKYYYKELGKFEKATNDLIKVLKKVYQKKK